MRRKSLSRYAARVLPNVAQIGAGASAVASTSASLCASGVCSIGAQAAGVGLMTAGGTLTATGVATALVTTANLSAMSQHTVVSVPPPWTLMLALAFLLGSTMYTVALVRRQIRLAILAGAGGLLAAAANLGWLSATRDASLMAVGVGVIPLVLAPWLTGPLPRWVAPASQWMIGAAAAGGLGAALYAQFALGMVPCTLCWVERIGLALVLAGVMANRRWPIWAGVFAGLVGGFYQLLEMQGQASDIAHLCSATGVVSCAAAGSQVVWVYPIGLEAAGLFVLLWLGVLIGSPWETTKKDA